MGSTTPSLLSTKPAIRWVHNAKPSSHILLIYSLIDGQLVAAGTIVLEHKFIRNAGIVGHIEDIVVSRELQGRKLGLRIIDALGEIGAATGCYKIILDCDQKNVGEWQALRAQ